MQLYFLAIVNDEVITFQWEFRPSSAPLLLDLEQYDSKFNNIFHSLRQP